MQALGDVEQRREFERLCASVQRKAYAVAYRFTGHRDESQDIVQQAFLRAYRSFHRYDPTRSFEHWFLRIINNLCVDRLRRRPKCRVLSLDFTIATDDGESECPFELPSAEGNPESLLMEQYLSEELTQALGDLPAEFRTAILLLSEERTYAQIAAEMKCSVGTVRSRLHRARVLLRKKLRMGPRAHQVRTDRLYGVYAKAL